MQCRPAIGNLQQLHPTKLSTQIIDLNTVDGVIEWRGEVGNLDSYPVDELIGSVEGALWKRFQINPYEYQPLPNASYQ